MPLMFLSLSIFLSHPTYTALYSSRDPVMISSKYWNRSTCIHEWLGHGLYCHDLEVMSSNPNWVELGVHSTSVPSRT